MEHLPVGWMAVVVLSLASWIDPVTAAPLGKFAFERGDDVWIANTNGTGAKKIGLGQSPDLSPDGTHLVYEISPPDVDKPKPPHLMVLDLASGKSTTLPTMDMNFSDPLWSPDGKQILLTIYGGSHASPGIIEADGSRYRDLHSPDYWGANWAADGKSLFTQDMENLYHLDLDGKILRKWEIASLIPHGEMSGASRLTPSPDGKTLLMDVEMDEKARQGWEGPPPAIYTMDLATEKCTRLTPKKFYAWSCCWLKAPDTILYVSQKPTENDSSIYMMSATGRGNDSKLLIKKASFPSVAR
jgi:TolB protein